MKKLTAAILTLLMLFALVLTSCSEETAEESKPDAESSLAEDELQNISSKPWYDTSAPDDYSNIIIDESSEPNEENSLPDISEPKDEASAPDVSTDNGPSSNGYDDLPGIDGYNYNRSASGYRIAFTKESALGATECITNVNIRIAAIYDGSVTRFFDAVNGTYYHAVSGKYLYPCCEGTFLAGDLNDWNSDYSITFTRGKDGYNENEVVFIMNDHAGHGIDYGYDSVYAEYDKKVYLYDQELYRVTGGAVPCRYYSGETPVLQTYFEDGVFEADKARIGKYGIASNEKVIVPFEYDLILTAQSDDENVGVYLAIKDGRSYYFSSDGRNLTPQGFDCGSQPYQNRAWVFEDGQGYIIEFN